MSLGIQTQDKIAALKHVLQRRRATLLCVGPMSLNCVDVAIKLANQHQVPLILIASRRQIDSEAFGGGYVNGWTTEVFCRYVRERDRGQQILLARDHGGPWQSELEVKGRLTYSEAMQSAQLSYQADIGSGMDILHLDPGHDPAGKATVSLNAFIERTQELLAFCHATARQYGREIAIEIGTDEGLIGAASPQETQYLLQSILDFCSREALPPPSFLVVQTGTKVMEMRNVGELDPLIRAQAETLTPQNLSTLIQLCKTHGLILKEHNADYLSEEALAWHPRIGIHSANVAPEFGVTETLSFLEILKKIGLPSLHDKVLGLAFQSRKWEKWMLANTTATDADRAIIAGHYVFSHPTFVEIKQEATMRCRALNIDLDAVLQDAIKQSMLRYMRNFRLIP